MSKFYKTLTDEELRQEIKRLKSLIFPGDSQYPTIIGVQETLGKYHKELELREKLDQ